LNPPRAAKTKAACALVVAISLVLLEWRLRPDGACPDCGTPLLGVFEEKPGNWGRKAPKRAPGALNGHS
jgi:hypothetical protein